VTRPGNSLNARIETAQDSLSRKIYELQGLMERLARAEALDQFRKWLVRHGENDHPLPAREVLEYLDEVTSPVALSLRTVAIARELIEGSDDAAAFLDIVIDGPPGPESGRFIECEGPDGASVKAGEWIERPDGMWALRIRKIKGAGA
jgi:hypothetical protein